MISNTNSKEEDECRSKNLQQWIECSYSADQIMVNLQHFCNNNVILNYYYSPEKLLAKNLGIAEITQEESPGKEKPRCHTCDQFINYLVAEQSILSDCCLQLDLGLLAPLLVVMSVFRHSQLLLDTFKMVCGWPILHPFFQQLCSRQVMVAASLSLSLSLYVGIFISLCVLEYSAACVCWNI